MRVGCPGDIGGLAGDVESPVFSTVVGLTKCGVGNGIGANIPQGWDGFERGNVLEQITTYLKDRLLKLKT